MSSEFRIAAIGFDQPHMAQLLGLVQAHARARIVAICDANDARLASVAEQYGVGAGQSFQDPDRCLAESRPDLVIACPAGGARLELIDVLASHDVAVLLDKPFAANAQQAEHIADRMKGRTFAVNWPLAFYPEHATAKRLIDAKAIGDVLEVHYFGGNKGPIYDRDAGRDAGPEQKARSWWYDKSQGGGSLMDYLGYGVTLGSWFMEGLTPTEITAVTDATDPRSVDEHSVTVARYPTGLSTYRTRWGTFTDPWIVQTQPKSGFVIVGRTGTISSYDYQGMVELQTVDDPKAHRMEADTLAAPGRNLVEYVLHCLETGEPVAGPCGPALSLLGQRMMDAALESASKHASVAFK